MYNLGKLCDFFAFSVAKHLLKSNPFDLTVSVLSDKTVSNIDNNEPVPETPQSDHEEPAQTAERPGQYKY